LLQVGLNVFVGDAAHRADANDVPRELVSRSRDHRAKALVHRTNDLFAAAAGIERHYRVGKILPRERRQSDSLAAVSQHPAKARVARQYPRQALLVDHFQRLREARDQRNRRGKGRLGLLRGIHRAAEVPIIA